jgi:4-azaleucine resistance transporter AzlC
LSTAEEAPQPRASRAGARPADFLLGAWQMLPLLLGVVPFGLILGALAADKGLSPLETALMSGLVFAGGSQFVAIGLWAHAIPVLVVVASTALVNLRHLLMGAALAPALQRFGARKPYLALFFLADEIWAVALRRAATGALTPAFYAGQVVPFYLSWILWTAVGNLAGSFVADPRRYGFDFAFAAVFLVILFGLWRGRQSILPVASSAAGALLAWKLLPGVWYIFIGGLAGTAAAILAGALPADDES